MKCPAVYIVANRKNGAVYTGVTSNLILRISQYKEGTYEGFAKRNGCKTLVYYESYDDMEAAITREKQLKAGSRKKKVDLIVIDNRDWKDLFPIIAG